MGYTRSFCLSCAFSHARQVFIQHEIWYSTPAEFNDPFECRFALSFEAELLQKLADFFRYFLVERGLSPETAFEDAKREVLGRTEDEIVERENRIQKEFKDSVAGYGICCLSEVNDDIVMWSHYADSHRGICLEFTADAEFHRGVFIPLPVRYQEEFPHLNAYDNWGSDEMVKKSVLTKAKHWEYEKEHRLIAPSKSGIHKFPPEILTGVVLGAKISEYDREEVKEWVRLHPTPVNLFQASFRPAQYALDIGPFA
jgi:hypothetical protein